MEFYLRLRELRAERSLTQKEAAAGMGMLTRQYQRFEQGEQKPGFDNMRKIADFYDVSVDWLMGRTETRTLS